MGLDLYDDRPAVPSRGRLRALWVVLFLLLALHRPAAASGLDPVQYVENAAGAGSFPVAANGDLAAIYVDGQDWAGVRRAAGDLQADIERVTDHKPAMANDPKNLSKHVVIVGTIGKSGLVDELIKAGKIDVSKVSGKWESFVIQVVDAPSPGVESALVIAGSDKRGTIFGIYDLSEEMGVSPWYWWADVPVAHQDMVYVKAGAYTQGEPSVKYRGIFLNDESPDLSNWVTAKFGQAPAFNGAANYGHEFYARLFELILRLKGNYCWPAMWNNAFAEDDPANPKLADDMGVVMGSSHQEPMLRAQKEWDRHQRGAWNYATDPATLTKFWTDGAKRAKEYESILTVGLRGANDTPMIRGGTQQQAMDLLKQIITDQRKLIAENTNPDVTKVPQLWCPYKEVLDYYNAGLRVPDDITILWTDDNWGNLRRVPSADERNRSGGAGIYYHFDYVGGPRNYKWINTNPISKIWEQMNIAKQYGADRIWIVNVGHFKDLEFPTEFFLRMAWNTNQWNNRNLNDYTKAWAEREFGAANAADIADIINAYTRFNGRRKPELLDPNTFSQMNYQEAQMAATEFKAVTARAEALYKTLPANQRNAFYELVLFPTKACDQVTELYVTAGRNALYAQQGRAATNDLAVQAQALFKADADLMAEFNKLNDGKWDHFMDQPHIGYTTWQDPARNTMPRVSQITMPVPAAMGIAADGGEMTLPRFDSLNQQKHFIDIYNKGQTAFACTIQASDPWIVVSEPAGNVEKEKRIWVSIDWAKAPQGAATGAVKIASTGGETVSIKVNALTPADVTRENLSGFAEDDRYVSIEAEHYTRAVAAGDVHWEKIDGYGKTLSAMTIVPVTAANAVPPQGACLEYKMYVNESGALRVLAVVSASLNAVPGRGLRYGVSFDDQAPQTITIVPQNFNAQNGNQQWEASVKDNARIVTSNHTLATPGYHTLKIWMVDPGVVLEKVVVDLGGVKPCYLGPPETYHH